MTDETIFASALEKADPAERAAFLTEVCGDDAERRRHLEGLLAAHAGATDFLERPAAAPEAPASWETRTLAHENGAPASDDETALAFLAPAGRPDSLGRIGHYEVLQILGKGGFGIVFRAFDEVLQRVVALKVLAPTIAATSPARKRFLREARSSAQVRHENVVQVHAVEEQPLPYLVMEFIPGETLQQRLDRTGPLETPEIVRIGRQIAEGLAAAHATGLIHRDIKPGNILLEGGHQRVKITDFGLARAADDASISQSGMLAGTPMYMAPEQARGETLDHRADLFSLGSVLYVMASGRPPFRASTTYAVLKRVVEDDPRPIRDVIPETPQWLCEIIARLQAKKREDRFASAQEVADLLAQRLAQMHHLGNVQPPPVATPAAKTPPSRTIPQAAPERRRPRFRAGRWAAVAAVCVLLLGAFGFTEATGVTDVHGTVIRLFSPEGTLVVEVDDPGVSVKIDGSDVVITGAGAKEIRLKPGSYTVEASKDGKLVSREFVTVAKLGKQVVRISQEAPVNNSPPPASALFTDADVKRIAALPVAEQVEEVGKELKRRNPQFDGALNPTSENDVVVGLNFTTDHVTDLSPLHALTHLHNLQMPGSAWFKGSLADLTPLHGLPLTSLNLTDNGGVVDLSALKGMPLHNLNLTQTGVTDLAPLHGLPLESLMMWGFMGTDLTPLQGMPLKLLNCGGRGRKIDLTPLAGLPLEFLCVNLTQASDLTPLKDVPLSTLLCSNTSVSDLAPLRGKPLKQLQVFNTKASDLSPLKGMPLAELECQGSGVTDLAPLKDMPLTMIKCDFQPERDAKVLRAIKTLKTINDKPAEEFWTSVDHK